MSPESLLEQFGYFAVFFGTFLEGEAILVAAGFFASRGYAALRAVAIVAFAGAFFGHLVLVLARPRARREAARPLPADEAALRQRRARLRALRRVGDHHHAMAVRTAHHLRGDHRHVAHLGAEVPPLRGRELRAWALSSLRRLLLRPRHRHAPRPRRDIENTRSDHRGHRHRLLACGTRHREKQEEEA